MFVMIFLDACGTTCINTCGYMNICIYKHCIYTFIVSPSELAILYTHNIHKYSKYTSYIKLSFYIYHKYSKYTSFYIYHHLSKGP